MTDEEIKEMRELEKKAIGELNGADISRLNYLHGLWLVFVFFGVE